MESNIVFNKDLEAKSIYVMKIYNEEVPKVWDHFTKSDLLDLWWGPLPWMCVTKKMDFREGGQWLYAMESPNGENSMYAQLNYGEITEGRSFDGIDAFCDEKGNINSEMAQAKWLVGFTGVEEGTKVTFNIHYNSEGDIKQQLEMGFEEGFKTGLQQLENLLMKDKK